MAAAGTEISLLSMRIDGKHILSLPMEAAYTGGSETIGRLRLSGSFSGKLSLRYAYMITERIEASVSFDTAFIWHRLQEAGEWRIGGSAGFAWYPEEYLALRLPVSILWNRGGTLYAASLSLEEETYTNPLFSQTYSSFTALFSYPFAGKDRQGWCAYTASFAPDEWPGSVSILRYQTQALRNLFPYVPLPEQPQVGILNDLESQSYSTSDFGPTWIGN